MRRKVVYLAAAMAGAAAALSASEAAAQPYVSVSAGGAQLADNSATIDGDSIELSADTGIAANVAVGYRLTRYFRVELEGGYAHADINKVTVNGTGLGSSGDLEVFTGMVNAFVDVPTGTAFTPYVGGGVGVAAERLKDLTVGGVNLGSAGTVSKFAWQVEGGLGFAVTKQLTIAPSYRFLQIQDASDGFGNSQVHIFRIGLRYAF